MTTITLQLDDDTMAAVAAENAQSNKNEANPPSDVDYATSIAQDWFAAKLAAYIAQQKQLVRLAQDAQLANASLTDIKAQQASLGIGLQISPPIQVKP